MLVELEQGLVELLRHSPLADKLRQIEALPDLDGDSLVGKFGADAPAVYVAAGAGRVASRGLCEPTLGIACVTRNSRSPQAARQGDGVQIGLLELVEAVMVLLEGAVIGEQEYTVTGYHMVASEALYRKGLYGAVVQVQTAAALPLDYTGD